VNLYSAFIVATTLQSAQAWITQFYLQITPRLPFLRVHSPDVATTATAAADIQLQRKDTGQRPMLYRWTTQPTGGLQ